MIDNMVQLTHWGHETDMVDSSYMKGRLISYKEWLIYEMNRLKKKGINCLIIKNTTNKKRRYNCIALFREAWDMIDPRQDEKAGKKKEKRYYVKNSTKEII